MALPNGFIDLFSAYNAALNSFVNIVGVVVDIMPPAQTRSGEYMSTFKILDQRLHDSAYGSQGLTVRFFKADPHSLPPVRHHGDIILLRSAKMITWSQQPLAISNYSTSILVFQAESIPEPSFQIAFNDKKRIECLGVPIDKERLSLEEQAYVIHLKHEMSAALQSLAGRRSSVASIEPPMISLPPRAAPPPGAPTGPAAMNKRPGEAFPPVVQKRPRQELEATANGKLKQIRELQHYQFADIEAQVVKTFPTQWGCDLYVTDYTRNDQMFYYTPPEEEDERERDGDEFGYSGPPKKAWPGPYGWLVLKVNVPDPHAYYLNREVNEGDFVLLRNVKMKQRAQLEGNMWPDDRNPEKVLITKLRNPQTSSIQAILDRKEKYWTSRRAKVGASGLPDGEKKTKLTKGEKKKQKKAAAAAGREARNGNDGTAAPNEAENGRSKADLNPHIRCSNEEVPISSIREIIDPENKRHTNSMPDGTTYELAFVNAKYRARVRVVDFAPRELEDFALQEPVDDGENFEDSMILYESSPKYKWSFSLLLEDSSKQKIGDEAHNIIWVSVGHQEAQYLLGNDMDDPVNLHDDARLLAKLREKLCILWGNLEEKAEGDAISNRAFECCLSEYGVEMDDDDPDKKTSLLGFRRLHGMFGVTIL